jgi:hypothetical protein
MIDHWIVETYLFKLSTEESSYWSHCSSQEQQHWKHLTQETKVSQSSDTQCLSDRKFDIECFCVDDDSAIHLKS